MRRRRILVVDDTPSVLDDLVAGLSREAEVVACPSGEEAVGRVHAEPGSFDFAVIDQLLERGIDGIETCRRIADISGDIFILVFTNVPATDQAQFEEHRFRAFEAGAHRYFERESQTADLLGVKQFVDEMEQLAQLRARMADFYDERRQIPSLLTQLDLGVDIIDRFYKVWFMNDAMRRITGVNRTPEKPGDRSPSGTALDDSSVGLSQSEQLRVSGSGLPQARCSAWHGYRLCPCPGCLVAHTLETGRPGDRIFLSPIRWRGGGLYYLHVWSQPVTDDHGNVMLASSGKPLAVMETVQDLTDSEQLRAMALDERLRVIAAALSERLRPGYVRRLPFERVAIYSIDPRQSTAGALRLRALAGYSDELAQQYYLAPFDPQLVSAYQEVLANMETTGWGYFRDDARGDPIDGRPVGRCVYWPVLDGANRLIAFLMARGESCEEGDVKLVQAYAQQVVVAVEQCRPSVKEILSLNAERRLAGIDNKLQSIGLPEAALRYLLTEGCAFTGSHLGHIRFRQEDQAVLLPLSPHRYDGYMRVASERWPLNHPASWSARTILSGIEHVCNDLISLHDRLETDRQNLSEPARMSLESARSFCFEPLVFDARCVGAIGFHSEKLDTFCGDNLLFLRQIARRASMALGDYLAKRTAEEQLAGIQARTVQLVLHNINTPLGTLRNCVTLLRGAAANDGGVAEEVTGIADVIERACNRIGRIREDFGRLLHTHESNPAAINLHKAIKHWVASEVGRGREVHVSFDLDDRLTTVVTDGVVAQSCVEVFVRNSLDEFARLPQRHEHVLRISLRIADDRDLDRVRSADEFLAIEIQDNGSGVAKETRGWLFDVIRSTKPGGLGIGLVCCRRLARAAGGDVFVKDQVSPGATFVAVLPYRAPAGQASGQRVSHANPPRG